VTASISSNKKTRRDFLILAASAMGGVGTVGFAWPFINSMRPAADTRALSSLEVNLAPIIEGQAVTVMWQGKPVFIRHRTKKEIEIAREHNSSALVDPEKDENRFKSHPQWLIVVGVCTHLGCVPLGQKPTDPRGDYNGWFCPCHGSHYDTSGRIRKGPAPKNLPVPPYAFLKDTLIRIG
jgi:ubiquinol-cytochrome c reductase iron-sulfur subunit